MRKYEKVDKWIDLSVLPTISNTNRIDWGNSIGIMMQFKYNKYNGILKIVNKITKDKYKVVLYINNESIEYVLNSNGIKKCELGGAFKIPIAITNPEFIKYFVNQQDAYTYSIQSNKKVEMICPLCGTKKEQYVRVLAKYGLACPMCSDGISYPNKFMFNVLTQLDINFKNEVTKATPGFEWIVGNYRYDFYVEYNHTKVFIEMDGKFHLGNKWQTYEKAQKTDQLKDKLALQHGIKVIRINCMYSKIQNRYKYIKDNIVTSELNSIFNLSNINWDVANSFAVSSNIALAAELWNDKDYCVIDIGNKLGVSRDTARGYLKIASKLGLCAYNDNEVEIRMINKIKENNKKKSKQ